MKNSFYETYRERHDLPTMDEKLEAAGVAPANHTNIFALEHALEEKVGKIEMIRIESEIWEKFPRHNQHAERIAALQDAIAATTEQHENIAAALESEATVTIENGFTPEQEQQAIQQTSRARRREHRWYDNNPALIEMAKRYSNSD